MRKQGTRRWNWPKKGRSLEVWCDGKEIGVQVRVHPATDNPNLLDNWVKAGFVCEVEEAIAIAGALLTAHAMVKKEASQRVRATILRP